MSNPPGPGALTTRTARTTARVALHVTDTGHRRVRAVLAYLERR